MTPTSDDQEARPCTSDLPPVYEPPRVELVLTAENLAREAQYGGVYAVPSNTP